MSKKVSLHVYDLSQGLARQLSQQLIGRHFDGIYHTGIVVFGREYFFGGGIFDAGEFIYLLYTQNVINTYTSSCIVFFYNKNYSPWQPLQLLPTAHLLKSLSWERHSAQSPSSTASSPAPCDCASPCSPITCSITTATTSRNSAHCSW